jgi:hypothetical protein
MMYTSKDIADAIQKIPADDLDATAIASSRSPKPFRTILRVLIILLMAIVALYVIVLSISDCEFEMLGVHFGYG